MLSRVQVAGRISAVRSPKLIIRAMATAPHTPPVHGSEETAKGHIKVGARLPAATFTVLE